MPPLSLKGLVTKVGCMNKTATVTVSRWAEHPKTQKRIVRSKKYLTHDPENESITLKIGDEVLIRNCPPVSARKRFALEKIIRNPKTLWEKAQAEEANKNTAKTTGSGTSLGGGEKQGPLDVTAGGSEILKAVRSAKFKSMSKMGKKGMAGVLGSKSMEAAPSMPS
ncbi:hypothetical protein M422DRAFT_189151 [Sphaerobolus stellatus SS14]|uniref:30S ribosomal protein S17 n=1 Tax=Sphaerobolus stellatus (strain SS14) TaxID=990650 RepID=A0A0C9THC7_SPHS4|nr:hypothetical protein M422DRAFT_189151 [Sphaerobolus stellatus SS14]